MIFANLRRCFAYSFIVRQPFTPRVAARIEHLIATVNIDPCRTGPPTVATITNPTIAMPCVVGVSDPSRRRLLV